MLGWVDVILHELLLFAAVGLFIGGLDDFLVDTIWLSRLIWRRQFVFRIYAPASMENLAPPDRPGRIAHGSIRLDGRDLLAMDAAEIRRLRGSALTMIFQDPMTSLNPVFTVGQQLDDVMHAHGVSDATLRR